MPKIKFKGENKKFDLIENGVYPARISKIEDKDDNGDDLVSKGARTSGCPMWKIEFTIIDGDAKGRKCFERLVFADSTAWKVEQLCEACGFDVDPNTEVDVEKEDLIDKRLNIEVYVRREEGYKDSNAIRRFTVLEEIEEETPFDGD